MKHAEAERILRKSGRAKFVEHAGIHDMWYSDITHLFFLIPRHAGKEVPAGTLHNIELQSGVSLRAKPRHGKSRS